ncbi:MAG: pyridoxal-phosphate dependent enzyme, partial [Longimicrobiales bacterium]
MYPRYDLQSLARTFTPDALKGRECSLWRYAEVLPVRDSRYRLTLGEGMTPLIETKRLATDLGLDRVWIKDEGQNPTASFKARGLAMAVARAAELGVTELAIPYAGNAGSAAAADAAAAGMPVHI